MPAVEATPVSSSESTLIKMEDRKRPAGQDQNDAAPPLKRQATSVNGNRPHPDADMPWKDDLEVSLFRLVSPPPALTVAFKQEIGFEIDRFLTQFLRVQRFTKDAIWRQMQEFKREKLTLESKVKDMTKAAAFHQDHLRIVDAWFKQVRCL